ncbi:MAG: phosphoribosylamine--glycine ligase [Desulfobacterota bacterium]|nr:phosphoribosylamine--glycine ligase [Thermodesulfobacteriota bacterium]MDW8002169.1 phosphoribosylamine--glycine ligase [Deltaproteobacteria bacterium]
MRVLVVGGGGREHSIVWKLLQSKNVSKIFCAPGNGGISDLAECVPIEADDVFRIVEFSKKEKIDFVCIGPENPLANGIVDELSKNGILAFGPSEKAAKIETSKVFAKKIMTKYKIRTAQYEVFENFEEALNYVNGKEPPFVIKADGLCGGKGSYVIRKREDAYSVLEDLFVKKVHGKAGERVIIEEYLHGQEVSYLVFSDGKSILPLITSQDHKTLFENDTGPNTGGMGAYAPVPFVSDEMEGLVKESIMSRAIEALRKEGVEYRGILYGGIILVGGLPYVLEFNARFGDPETQAILVQMDSDLLPIMVSCAEGNIKGVTPIQWKKGFAVCVVIASRGYPERPEKGKLIEGLENLKDESDIVVFHAGTKKVDGKYYTAGGRVLNVVARGEDINEAIEKAYSAIEMIRFEGMHFRRDIGRKAQMAKM